MPERALRSSSRIKPNGATMDTDPTFYPAYLHMLDQHARECGKGVSDLPSLEMIRLLRSMVPDSLDATLRRQFLAATGELLEAQARLAAELHADLIKHELLFPMFYGGIQIDIWSVTTGLEFASKDVARALGCPPHDIGVTGRELMTLDAVEAASANRGLLGVMFREWLEKTIRPNDDGVEITPAAIRDGLMVNTLTPTRSKSGDVVQLKRNIKITPAGIEWLQLGSVSRPPSASVH
jgi:hypothetical protein